MTELNRFIKGMSEWADVAEKWHRDAEGQGKDMRPYDGPLVGPRGDTPAAISGYINDVILKAVGVGVFNVDGLRDLHTFMLDKDRNYDALVYLIKYLKSIGCKLDGPAHADIRAIAKELVQCASGTRLDRKAIVKRLGLSRAQVYKLAKDLEFGTQRNGTFDARKVDAYKAKMKPNKRREDKSARAKGRKNNRAFLSSLSTDD